MSPMLLHAVLCGRWLREVKAVGCRKLETVTCRRKSSNAVIQLHAVPSSRHAVFR
jgi:hypothetical protein